MPPGQVRHTGLFSRYDRPDFWGLRGLTDGRYFYNDGYLMRLGVEYEEVDDEKKNKSM